MFCKKCGSDLPSNSQFCYNCGEKTVLLESNRDKEDKLINDQEIKKLVVNESMFKKCPNCNQEIKHSGGICRFCEARVIDDNSASNARPNNVEKAPWHQGFKWWHILILSFVSLLIYFLTYWEIFDWIFLVGLIFSIVILVKTRKSKK